jgi:glycosyltransferase involved in cell wall biosynthesis
MKQRPIAVHMLKTHYPHWGERTAFNAFLRYFDRRAFAVIMEEVPMGNGELLPKPFSLIPWLRLHGERPQEYGWPDLRAEMRMFRRAFLDKIDVLHFIDAEHSLSFLPGWFQKFRHLKKFPKIIAMFHQPPAILEKIIDMKTAGAADLVLTVSPEQADFFARFLPAERIATILLGVDTEYFKPPDAKKSLQEFKCLAGGVWLRDYPAILKTAELLAEIPEITFHLVAPPGQFRALPENIVLHSGISDAALLDLYQNCHVLFLPLKDATANTFLLEGSACGLPVVSSALPSLRAYFPGEEAILVPGNDPQVFAGHLLELFRDPQRLAAMSGHARRRALHLSWEKIVPEYERLYRELDGAKKEPGKKKSSGEKSGPHRSPAIPQRDTGGNE